MTSDWTEPRRPLIVSMNRLSMNCTAAAIGFTAMMHFKGFFMFPYVGKIESCVSNWRKQHCTSTAFALECTFRKTSARDDRSESRLTRQKKKSQTSMTTTNMVTRYMNGVSVRKEVRSDAALQTAVRPLNPSRHEDGEFLSEALPARELLTTNTTSTISVCLSGISATRSNSFDARHCPHSLQWYCNIWPISVSNAEHELALTPPQWYCQR